MAKAVKSFRLASIAATSGDVTTPIYTCPINTTAKVLIASLTLFGSTNAGLCSLKIGDYTWTAEGAGTFTTTRTYGAATVTDLTTASSANVTNVISTVPATLANYIYLAAGETITLRLYRSSSYAKGIIVVMEA